MTDKQYVLTDKELNKLNISELETEENAIWDYYQKIRTLVKYKRVFGEKQNDK